MDKAKLIRINRRTHLEAMLLGILVGSDAATRASLIQELAEYDWQHDRNKGIFKAIRFRDGPLMKQIMESLGLKLGKSETLQDGLVRKMKFSQQEAHLRDWLQDVLQSSQTDDIPTIKDKLEEALGCLPAEGEEW